MNKPLYLWKIVFREATSEITHEFREEFVTAYEMDKVWEYARSRYKDLHAIIQDAPIVETLHDK